MKKPALGTVVALALSLSVTACVQRETPVKPPNPDSEAPRSMPLRAMFRIDLGPDGTSGLVAGDAKRFVSTLDGLAQELPDFAALSQRDARYLPQLAQALMHLTIGKEAVVSREASVREMLGNLDGSKVFSHNSFHTDHVVSGPVPSELNPPRWEGERLVINVSYDLGGSPEPAYVGSRYFFRFENGKWSFTFESLPSESIAPSAAVEAITALFGGEVQGFVRVSWDPSSRFTDQGPQLFVALGTSTGASRYVLRDKEGKTQRYASFTEFGRAMSTPISPELRARFADDLYQALAEQHGRHDHYKAIASPSAYREAYQKEGRDTHKLRYYVDQLRVTRFTVSNFDALAEPAITNEVLVSYFEDGRRQPNKLRLDLSTLSWASPIEMEELFESKVISDTGLGSGVPSDVPLMEARPSPIE